MENAMSFDEQESHSLLANVATLIERTKNLDKQLANIDNRLVSIEKAFGEFQTAVSWKLGKYSVLAAIGVGLIAYAIQQFMGR